MDWRWGWRTSSPFRRTRQRCTVNTIADTGAAPGSCTLRDAITSANTDTPTGGCAAGSGADTIEFSVTGTVVLGSTLPVIAGDITINDPPAATS